jgi:hypothetical protein
MTEIATIEGGVDPCVCHVFGKQQGDAEAQDILHSLMERKLEQTTLPQRIEGERHMDDQRSIKHKSDRRVRPNRIDYR